MRLACHAFAIAAVLTASEALADDGPWNPHLVGDRAMGYSGAFVGLADDPSTIFHNPGGVGMLETSSLSGSLTVLGFGDREIEDGYQTVFGRASLTHSGSRALPVFLGGVVRFGPRDSEGVRRHALGASFTTPYENDYEYREGVRAGERTARILVQHDERARWYGLAYGYRFDTDLALGVSLFVVDWRVDHDELERLSDDGPVADLPPDGFLTRETSYSGRMFWLTPRFGAVLDVDEKLRLGLMFQPPSVQFETDADTRLIEARVDAGGVASSQDVVRGALEATMPMPWEIRAGASYRPGDDTVLTLDLSLLGPVASEDSPQTSIGVPAGDETLGQYAPRTSWRNPAFRAAVGFGILLADHVPIQGGALLQLPGTPSLPETANEPMTDHLTSFGGSISVGYRSDIYNFAVGVSTVFATGDALAPLRDTAGGATVWRRVSADERTVLIFVAGGTRTAAQVARTIVESVGNPDDEDGDED